MKLKISLSIALSIVSGSSMGMRLDWNPEALKGIVDIPKFQKFVDYAFDKNVKYLTDGVVIVQNGRLLFERYARGFTVHTKHRAWSASKSITGILIGIAEAQGLLSRDDLVSVYYPNIFFNFSKNDKEYKEKIQIHHLSTPMWWRCSTLKAREIWPNTISPKNQNGFPI